MNRNMGPYQTETFREKQRVNTTNLWQTEEYRNKVSKAVSDGQYASWATGTRKQGKKVPTYPKFVELAKENNYEMLTSFDEFIISGVIPTLRCPNGHLFKVTYKDFKNGRRCDSCILENRLKSIDEMLIQKNYELIDINFTNTKRTKFFPNTLNICCDKGHIWNNVILGNFLNGHECRFCKQTVSSIEYEIRNFLDMNNIKYIQSDRTIIAPLELDFILPEYKIAIEFDGYPYHTELKGGKGKTYHLYKTEECEKAGYQLIHIFYDEWEEPLKTITINRLLHIFKKDVSEKIFARKCEVKNIDTQTYRDFCIKNHLQGYAQASIKLGLFYNNTLVSIMSFSKPNRAKGNMKDKNDVWELARACSNCNIIGGAGKLLEHFKKHNIWAKIITYADRRWSLGNVYEKIGFNFIRNTQPNYWYLNSKAEKFYRYQFRKSQLNGIGTEWDQMKELGYDRIWDCGHKLYEIENT